MKMREMQHFGSEAMFRLDHVSDAEGRKAHQRLFFAVGGRSGYAVAYGVDEHHEITCGVDDFADTDELQEVRGFSTQPTRPQNGV